MKLITRGLGGYAGFLIIRGFGSIILSGLKQIINFTVRIVKEVSFVFR